MKSEIKVVLAALLVTVGFASPAITADRQTPYHHLYRDDTNLDGTVLHRRWYVSPLDNITDHSDSTRAGSIAWVISQVGDSSADIELPGNHTYVFHKDYKIPSNIRLVLQKGAALSISSGHQLSINGLFDAGLWTVFTGSGTLRFASQSIREILVEWFANDLTKAYDAATSQQIVKMSTNGPYVISGTVYATKIDVHIMGQEQNSSQIFPSAGFSDTRGIVFGDNGTLCHTLWPSICSSVNTSGNWNLTIANINLDGRIAGAGTPVIQTGIEVKSSHHCRLDRSYIQHMGVCGIYVNGTEKAHEVPLWAFGIIESNIMNNPIGLYAVKHGNSNFTEGIHAIRSWFGGIPKYCNYGVKLVERDGQTLTVSFHDSAVEGADIACVDINGTIQVAWIGGFIEGSNDNPHIVLNRGASMDLEHAWVGGSTVRVDRNSRLLNRGSCLMGSELTRTVSDYVVGKISDGDGWGPPNQPLTKPTAAYPKSRFAMGTVWTDAYGTRWTLMEGSNKGALQRWRALDGIIRIPISHNDIMNSATFPRFMAWYPDDDFVLTEVEYLPTIAWDGNFGATWLSFGTDRGTERWISATQGSKPNLGDTLHTIQAKKNTHPTALLADDAHYRMTSMKYVQQAEGLEMPVWDSPHSNYIAVYTPPWAVWTSGQGILMIKGFYINHLPYGTY